ncbi:MAG: hypothetical protein QM714_00235 [Nocardioides sp.]|uniref:hypothetical protein n=1 Tax=Nocardioides sp. TaxID=35761 RepID=UPI0039E36650
MGFFRGDASEVYALASDLAQIGAESVPAMRGVIDDAGQALAKEWQSNARATSGAHGVHYPDSISAELVFGMTNIAVDVGPEAALPQGSMGRGFEYGSINSPPHLDGLRALDGMQGRVERMTDAAIGHLFG